MAKLRNRKAQLRDNGGSQVDMEVSNDAPAPSQLPANDAMDTSECVVGSSTSQKLSVDKSGKLKSRGISKIAPKRRSVKIRKKKAIEKALSMMEKSAEKKQKFDHRAERIKALKKLY